MRLSTAPLSFYYLTLKPRLLLEDARSAVHNKKKETGNRRSARQEGNDETSEPTLERQESCLGLSSIAVRDEHHREREFRFS